MAELKRIAISALEGDGWKLEKSPDHHGLAMVYITTNEKGDRKLIAIRTTKNSDNGISFVPSADGQHWKTLFAEGHCAAPDEIVIVSANDLTKVYIFKGDDVRKMYLAEYKKRVSNGKKPQLGRGFWIPLRDFPTDRVELSAGKLDASTQEGEDLMAVVSKAREMVAEAAGVEIECVRLSIEWFQSA